MNPTNRRTALLGALVLTLAAGACSESPPSPEAKAAAEALSALGLEGVTFRSAKTSAGSVELDDVTGRIDGLGSVKAKAVTFSAPRTEAGTWKADRIVVSDLATESGATVAKEASAAPVEVRTEGSARSARVGDLALKNFDGPLLGARVKARFVARTYRNGLTQVSAEEASLDAKAFAGLPDLTAKTLAGQKFDLVLDVVDAGGGNVDVRLAKLTSALGSLTGEAKLSGNEPGRLEALLAVGLPGILVPGRWPEGYALRSIALSGNVVAPDADQAFTAKPADGNLAAMSEGLAVRLARGGPNLELAMRPSIPVQVSALPRIFEGSPDASRELGVSVTGLLDTLQGQKAEGAPSVSPQAPPAGR